MRWWAVLTGVILGCGPVGDAPAETDAATADAGPREVNVAGGANGDNGCSLVAIDASSSGFGAAALALALAISLTRRRRD